MSSGQARSRRGPMTTLKPLPPPAPSTRKAATLLACTVPYMATSRLPRIGARRGRDCADSLVAAAGELEPSATVAEPGGQPKYFWVDLNDSRRIAWTVDVARDGAYLATLAVHGAADARVEVLVDGGLAQSAECPSEWANLALGLLRLRSGERRIELRFHTRGQDTNLSVRSLELIHDDELGEYHQRLADYRQASRPTLDRLRRSGFGLMVQYGRWSYPRTGTRLPSDHVEVFDVERFLDQVQACGATHVIWSLTWWTFDLAAPSRTVDGIVGATGATPERDLVGELASAAHERGLLFFLYFHPGHDAHLGYNSTEWWRAQRWPDTFHRTGTGDRARAMSNLRALLTELGERYADRLDGWFLDDGMLYHPAPFEALADDMRAGNSARLISYNPWILPAVTPFQDLDFGEGRRDLDSVTVAEDGVLLSGPADGLYAHCMEPVQDEWGVHEPDQYQPLSAWSGAGLNRLMAQARPAQVAVTFDLLMWYPGEMDPAALARLTAVKAALDNGAALENDAPLENGPAR